MRDVADFALQCASQPNNGAFNVAAPMGRDSFGALRGACTAATGALGPEFVWISDEELLRAGVRQWSEMPLWRTFDGVWRVDASRALVAGLVSRPLAETVRDTWRWLVESGDVTRNERSSEIGLSAERERELLALIS